MTARIPKLSDRAAVICAGHWSIALGILVTPAQVGTLLELARQAAATARQRKAFKPAPVGADRVVELIGTRATPFKVPPTARVEGNADSVEPGKEWSRILAGAVLADARASRVTCFVELLGGVRDRGAADLAVTRSRMRLWIGACR